MTRTQRDFSGIIGVRIRRLTSIRLTMRILLATIFILPSFAATSAHFTQMIPTPDIDTPPVEDCPPCDLLFGRLKRTSDGRRFQHVDVMERGEPKSGTGFMMEWAGGSLIHSCRYLNHLYGEGKCSIDMTITGSHELGQITLNFQPGLETYEPSRCVCENIDSVIISLDREGKHQLPVSSSCPWAHPSGLANITAAPCVFDDGSLPTSYESLWRCVVEAGCEITDSRDQMAIFRDPRDIVVSTYFYSLVHHKKTVWDSETIDHFTMRALPILCQWTAIRFILFQGMMLEGQRSTLLWYMEAMSKSVEWHQLLLYFIGLQLPMSVVEKAVSDVLEGEFDFKTKGVDKHPGGSKASVQVRTYKDEVSPETAERFDDILRTWLPPSLLSKLGVPPSA